MVAKRTIDEELRDEVARMYLAGSKLNEIERETGVPRGSVYWILKQRKIEPARTHPNARMNTGQTASQTIEWTFQKLLEQERRVFELESEIEELKAQLALAYEDGRKAGLKAATAKARSAARR